MRLAFAAPAVVLLSSAAFASRAGAELPSVNQLEHQPLNQLGDHIAIPGLVAKQAFTFDFQIDGFQVKGDQLFALGILSGGNLSSPVQVAIPVRGLRDDRGRGGPEIRGGFGVLPRPSPTQPAVLQGAEGPLLRTALVQHASSRFVMEAQATQTCQIVSLALGATNVDVLGVVVNLQPVALDVGVAGGGLVGALVCALVGLL